MKRSYRKRFGALNGEVKAIVKDEMHRIMNKPGKVGAIVNNELVR